jgi:hypothetical protein
MREFQKLLRNYYILLSLYNKSISVTKVFNHPMLISEVNSMRSLFWKQSQLLVKEIDVRCLFVYSFFAIYKKRNVEIVYCLCYNNVTIITSWN